MRKNCLKKLFFLGLVLLLPFFASAKTETPELSLSPATLRISANNDFAVSVQIDPKGNKVCVVQGKLSIAGLSCQSILPNKDLMAQTMPSCDNLQFTIGIPHCATTPTTLFSLNLKGEKAGEAKVSFENAKVVGEGTNLDSFSKNATYLVNPAPGASAFAQQKAGAKGKFNLVLLFLSAFLVILASAAAGWYFFHLRKKPQ